MTKSPPAVLCLIVLFFRFYDVRDSPIASFGIRICVLCPELREVTGWWLPRFCFNELLGSVFTFARLTLMNFFDLLLPLYCYTFSMFSRNGLELETTWLWGFSTWRDAVLWIICLPRCCFVDPISIEISSLSNWSTGDERLLRTLPPISIFLLKVLCP